MNDLKRISIVAVFLLVLLRISIGWQFVYEGMWKYSSLQSPNPWTAEGYLKSSQGPFRDHFRELTGDPDDLNWLNYELMSQKWDGWQAGFVAHYGLDEDQQARLTRSLEGAPQYVADLSAIPDAASAAFEQQGVIEFDSENGRLVVQGDTPLEAREAVALKARVDVVAVPISTNNLDSVYARIDENGEALRDADGAIVPADEIESQFFQAIEKLERDSARLGYRQRLRALLEGDPDRVGVVFRLGEQGGLDMGSIASSEQNPEAVNVNFGRIRQYRDELAAYEAALVRAQQTNLAYKWDHVETLGAKLSSLRAELVGPVRALEAEMKAVAQGELTPEQIALGPIPPNLQNPLSWNLRTEDRLFQASAMALWGLLILGVLLILGACTRLSALLGAAMLIGFYLVLPPWPGVPQPPSPEHKLHRQQEPD